MGWSGLGWNGMEDGMAGMEQHGIQCRVEEHGIEQQGTE